MPQLLPVTPQNGLGAVSAAAGFTGRYWALQLRWIVWGPAALQVGTASVHRTLGWFVGTAGESILTHMHTHIHMRTRKLTRCPSHRHKHTHTHTYTHKLTRLPSSCLPGWWARGWVGLCGGWRVSGCGWVGGVTLIKSLRG